VSVLCRRGPRVQGDSYFVASQARPVAQRQVVLQLHRSPQAQRSAFVFAHPQDDLSQRHSFWVWFAIGSLLVSGALRCALSDRKTHTAGEHYTRCRDRRSAGQITAQASDSCCHERECGCRE